MSKISSLHDDVVDRWKLGFKILFFEQQFKASLEQLYFELIVLQEIVVLVPHLPPLQFPHEKIKISFSICFFYGTES